jgi:hypothetical protein
MRRFSKGEGTPGTVHKRFCHIFLRSGEDLTCLSTLGWWARNGKAACDFGANYDEMPLIIEAL